MGGTAATIRITTDMEDDYKSDPYDLLPTALKTAVTRNQYKWMSDRQKQDLQSDLTQPEEVADY